MLFRVKNSRFAQGTAEVMEALLNAM